MNPKPGTHREEHLDLLFLFALQALPPREIASVEAQISSCEGCQQEIETLRPIVRSLSAGPPMSCAPRNLYGAGSQTESPAKRPRSRSYLRWNRRLNESGKKRRQVFTSKYSRETRKTTASACWSGLIRERIIPDTRMQASKNCIFSTAY